MGAREPTQFMLTAKGVDELSQRRYRLDARERNILFLIQKGTPTIEGILDNTIFPRDVVVERLQALVREQFVTAHPGSDALPAAPRPATLPPAIAEAPMPRASSDFPQLDSGVSISQARFVLSDFCLDLFGTKGKPLIEALGEASDLESLQRALEQVTREVRRQRRSQMSALLARVREINALPSTPPMAP